MVVAFFFLVIAHLTTRECRAKGEEIAWSVAATGLGSLAVSLFCAVALLARLAGL
jgi:hypothetical protein